jgi:hypothetical protein
MRLLVCANVPTPNTLTYLLKVLFFSASYELYVSDGLGREGGVYVG